jgi:hypothetical protein
MYGCSVPELYNKLKNAILDSRERVEDKEDNNIVREYTMNSDNDTEDEENYKKSLDYSSTLQTSPYIIIIDPVEDEESLNHKWELYSSLDDKHRRLSDYYSWMCWGYNVYNMYQIVKDKLLNQKAKEEDSENNLYYSEKASTVNNFESCIDASYDYINAAYNEGKILTIERFRQNSKVNTIKEFVYDTITKYGKIKFAFLKESPNNLILPYVVPWFDSSEIRRLTTNCEITSGINYYNAIKEAYDNNDAQKLINLGWNPTVPINKDSIMMAKFRQLSMIEAINYNNISDILEEYNYEDRYYTDINFNNLVIRPLYIVNIDKNIFGFSFSGKLDTIYQIYMNNDTMINIKKVSKNQIYPKSELKLLCVFVDKDAYNAILRNITNTEEINANNPYFNSIYNVLLNSRDTFDPDRKKVLYSYFIDLLVKIACYGDNTTNVPEFTDNKIKNIFCLYDGYYEDYSFDKLHNIMNIICDEDNLKKFLTDNDFETSKAFVDRLLAKKVIVSTTD